MNQTPEVTLPTAARRVVPIQADKNGTVPTQIEVLKAGEWPADSSKGNLFITRADLQEMKDNFDHGYGMPMPGFGLPIDFGHADWQEAAGWMKSLEVVEDTLMATVEWSDSGLAALQGGRYKLFSPSFYPSCLGVWYDYEDPSISASNVLSGGGLTNIPFFKGLKPIMASRHGQDDSKNVIYASADIKQGENNEMDVQSILAKDPSAVTTEEKAFLAENRNQLTGDQIEAFGVPEKQPETPVEPVVDPNKPVETPADPVVVDASKTDAAAILASIQSGKVVLVEASSYDSLVKRVEASESSIKGYERQKIEASVDEAVKRGAIKQDMAKTWADKIEADRSLETMIQSLPSNQVLANEIGSDKPDSQNASADEQLQIKINEAIKASVEAGKPLTYGQALTQVLASNTDLAIQRNQEQTGKVQ